MGVIATSIFDTGNAAVCLGGSHSIAAIVQGKGKFSAKAIAKALSKSVAFDCYVIMLIISILHIPLPETVFSFAQIIGNANAFVAMFMIGVGFKMAGDLDGGETPKENDCPNCGAELVSGAAFCGECGKTG